MNMMDLGRKDSGPTTAPLEANQSKVRYPSLTLSKNIPEELMGKYIGAECRLEIIVKVMGKSIDTYSEDKSERVELEIRKLGYIGKAGKLSKEEYLGKSDDEKAKYDEEQVKADAEEVKDEVVDEDENA